MRRFDMFVLSISVLGQLLVIGLIISDSYQYWDSCWSLV